MRKFFAAFARNIVFANILLAMIFTAGIMAVFGLVRETFPEFSLDIITVTVFWPGADPEEVEEGISRKIEESIEGIDGIKEYNTVSGENLATVLVEVADNYDMDYVKERVRNAVDSISTFPEEAEKPIIEEMLLRTEVAFLALTGEGMDERALKEWAERIKEELVAMPGISQVKVLGARDYEISIEVSEERLREYGLTLGQVALAVKASNLNLSGGTVRTKGEEIRLRTMGRKYTAEEFAEIVVYALPGGDVITLDRIADIRDDFTEDQVVSRFNGEPAITVAVLKTSDEDTLAIDDVVRDYVAKTQSRLPEGLRITMWGGTSDILQARIRLLVRNGMIGLTLVFIVLWLFLDIRLSFWAGMGMPISICGALAIMWVVGATLNMISLFGLIMVLGIIVDDAIVVGESIYVARREGAPMLRAAVDGVTEVGMPVVAAVLTSIVAFVPLAFVSGIMGKFIRILPVVVIACLAISLVECLILLPAHLSHLPDPSAEVKGRHPLRRTGIRFHRFTNRGLERFIERVYLPFIRLALRWRYVSLSVAVAVFFVAQGLMASGIVKFQVFPELDGTRLTATVEFPNGTPLAATQEGVEELERGIRAVAARTPTLTGVPLIQNIFSQAGSTIDDFRPIRGNHYGSVRVEMPDVGERGAASEDLLIAWEEEVGVLTGALSVSYMGDEAGPPGAPVEVWVQGHHMDSILRVTEAVTEKLRSYKGIYQLKHDFRPGKNEIKLRLKDEARALGLSVSDLATQVYAGYFGEEALRLQRGRDDIRVRVRYPAEERRRLDEFERARIRTPQGNEVPLLSVADIEYGPGFAAINRTNGMRRVAITAEVKSSQVNAQEVFADLEGGFFQQLRNENPGVMVSLQGDKKKSIESIGSLMVTYPLALLGIFIIIATMFRSYVQPLVIMVTVPFGIIGAILGHLFMGYNVSMMSIFGMVALSGVVVNDAIVLIECINTFLAKGTPFFEAIARGGARRFRAIFLTTISTVGGLTPLLLETDMQARFLIPMAISIAAGVAFATMLTLILVPCLLGILNDFRRIAHVLVRGEWCSPEEVEPARLRNLDPLSLQPASEPTTAMPETG